MIIGMITWLILTDEFGEDYQDIIQKCVPGPIGMTQSSFEQPLSSERIYNYDSLDKPVIR